MVITRFAPSPTGGLHIGSVRTILFNWLYAKHCGGKFMLRIEDTDIERSKPEHVQDIYETLNWLGMHWDGDVVFQLKNIARHQEVAHKLLAEGKAYKCYCTQEELAAMRELAMKEGRTPRYERKCRNLSYAEPTERSFVRLCTPTVGGDLKVQGPEERSATEEGSSNECGKSVCDEDKPYVVRLKCPTTGKTEFTDLIQGHCVIDNEHLDDMILLRSDGTPTYMLAVVVDDHDMGITNVIRASEHLNNTYRQKQIYEACGWSTPEFAHVSLIHGEDGAKLSKRHGATSIGEYEKMGFLKDAILNYLIHLGWNKSEEEILSMDECIKLFDIRDVRSSPARFSMAKLLNVNSIYMRAKSNEQLLVLLQEFAGSHKYDAQGWDRVQVGMDELKSRTRTLVELDAMSNIYGNGADYFGKLENLSAERVKFLKDLVETANFGDDIEEITAWLNSKIAEHGLTLKEVAPDLRFALTKEKVAPSIFELMKVLGSEIFAKRIAGAIA